jgi:hypothetical protein
MTPIDVRTLAPRVRAILADPQVAAVPTGDAALDKALADLAAYRRAAQSLPETGTHFWNSPRQPVDARTR